MNPMRFLTLLIATTLTAACGSQSTTPAEVGEIPDLPAGSVMYDSRHLITEDGVRNAELLADTAYIFEEENRVDMIGVRMRFFDESGAESGTLTSETGEYLHQDGRFVAEGNVILIVASQEGRREIHTEQLFYDTNLDRLWSDVPFTSEMEDGRMIRGDSFRTDSQFQSFHVDRAQTSGGSGGQITF